MTKVRSRRDTVWLCQSVKTAQADAQRAPRSQGEMRTILSAQLGPGVNNGRGKETLDARVEFLSDETDGRTQHRINQYVIQDEIGRGSYGAVHIGTDQFGTEYVSYEQPIQPS